MSNSIGHSPIMGYNTVPNAPRAAQQPAGNQPAPSDQNALRQQVKDTIANAGVLSDANRPGGIRSPEATTQTLVLENLQRKVNEQHQSGRIGQADAAQLTSDIDRAKSPFVFAQKQFDDVLNFRNASSIRGADGKSRTSAANDEKTQAIADASSGDASGVAP